MIPRSMSYGARFKSADRSHVEELKQAYSEEREDILARSRKIQQETNRRRKALAVKRKLEAAKEEKRRQEILANRREQQREATERFQRLGKPREQLLVNYQYNHPSKPSPALEEALRNVNGRTKYYARQNSVPTPVLEDALHAVRGSPNNHFRNDAKENSMDRHVRNGRPQSGIQRDRPPSGTKRSRPESAVKNNLTSYSQSTMGPADRIQEHALEVASRADLQSRSLLQTSNSRTLFEQQLQHQQSLLIEQQKESLHHFNSAIQKEMDKDEKLIGVEKEEILDPEKEMSTKMTRSDSLTSVDSLEADNGTNGDSLMECTPTHHHANISDNNNVSNDKQLNDGPNLDSTKNGGQVYNNSVLNNSVWGRAPNATPFGKQDSDNGSSNANASTVGFVLHRSPSNPSNIAVVSPSVIQTRRETNGYGNSGKEGTLDLGTFTPNKDYKNAGSNITGPHSFPNQDEISASDNLKNTEPYNVIKTSSNGRANGQYYQDSVVNNATTFILHGDAGIYTTAGNYMDHKPGAGQTDFDMSNKMVESPYDSKFTTTNATGTSGNSVVVHNNSFPSKTRGTYDENNLAYSPANYTDGPAASEAKVPSTTAGAAVSSNMIPTGFSHMAFLPHPPNVSAPSVRPTVTMADMRASSFAGNVNSTMSHFGAEHDDVMSEDSAEPEDDVPETGPRKQKVLKGILKKNRQPTVVGRGVPSGGRIYSAGTYTSRLRAQGRGRGATSNVNDHDISLVGKDRPSSSSSVRDSIEVARDQLSARRTPTKKPKRKSIRWADMTYSDDENEDPQELEKVEKEIKNNQNNFIQSRQNGPIINTQSKIPTGKNKPRPFSAKLSTNTTKVDTPARQSRVASAGTRRTPFVRPSIRNSLAASKAQMNATVGQNSTTQHNNWVSKHTVNSPASQNTSATASTRPSTTSASNVANSNSNTQYSESKVNPTQDKLASSVTAADIRKSVEGAVYDSNGIRLDRTPTDEEINWLWDKVRTCLSRQSTVDSIAGDNHSERAESAGTGNRQAAQMSSKYIDGTTLAPQLRTSTRVSTNYNNGITNDASTLNSTYPLKKKISMDTLNTYNRRVTSATQKKSPNINSGYLHTNGGPVYNNSNLTYNSGYGVNSGTYQQPQHNPEYSNHGPTQGVANDYNDQVISESMAEFLTAEMLAAKSGSLNDSELQRALDQRKKNIYNTANQAYQSKGPSALSIEEQKLLQSLERLNERLKVVEDHDPGHHPGSTPAVYVPRPPPHRPGFKGHTPLSYHRRYSANTAGSLNRHHYRIGSAGAPARGTTVAYH